MSMRQVQTASLSGYGSPYYPVEEIRQLVAAFLRSGPAGLMVKTLDAMAAQCAGYMGPFRGIRTADNYIWRRIIEFRTSRGRVAIAIPMTQDWNRTDGVQLDRSPAVFIADGATVNDAKAVVLALAHALSS